MQIKDFALIKKKIKKSSNIFIMGHKSIDLDAFGAALGIFCYASVNKKDAYLVIDDKKMEATVKRAISGYKEQINIINGKNVNDLVDSKSLLVIVDTTKTSLVQNSDILSLFNDIVIIDHHNMGNNTISGENVLIFNDVQASSTCEIIVKMLDSDGYSIPGDIATTLLAGIVLDTNNFIIKTDVDTYYAAYYLAKCGADSRQVQYLLKEDIKEYIEMQKVITEVKVIKNIAISKGLQTKIYRREDLAKIADTILLFKNIEVSFVVGKTSEGIGISARSMGNIKVGEILETLGGGGDDYEAATIIFDKNLNEVVDLIIKTAKKI